MSQVAEALENHSETTYEAMLPVKPVDGALIYVNSTSTCVCAALKQNPELTAAQASAQLKGHLFGAEVGKYMPGYTTEFLAHIAEPKMFSAQRFSDAVASAGGMTSWMSGVALGTAKSPVQAPFRRAARGEHDTIRHLAGNIYQVTAIVCSKFG